MRDAKRRQVLGTPDGGRPASDAFPSPPVQVLCGSVLCRLQVWDEAGWAALPESRRPVRSRHVPGLGWVGAVPVQCLN